MSFVEKLQNKPRFIRVQIMWISAIFVMVIIVFCWLTFFKASLLAQKPSNEIQEEQSIPSLFNTIADDFKLLKNSLQAEIKSINNGKNSNFEVEIVKPAKLPE